MANPEHLSVLKKGSDFWNNWRNQSFPPEMTAHEKSTRMRIDLTDADLSKVFLEGVNFFCANLNGVNLKDAYLLDAHLVCARLENANLEGIDLSSANVINASFNNSNLRNAKLLHAEALDVDFEGADLTGACIEDWNINSNTNFNNVICDYIYLKSGKEERRPSDPNRNFEAGEFTNLFQKALETVDLVFLDGINWKAFLLSLKELKDKYGEDNVNLQSIENKKGVFIAHVEVTPNVNKGEIESCTRQLYESNLKALEYKYRSELNAKEREINIYKQQSADMFEIVKLQASRPITVEAKAVAENQSKNVEVEMNFQAPVTGAAGKVEGDMNVYSSEQKHSITEVATEIVKLLDYFEQHDPSITQAQQIVNTATENQPEILDAEIIEEAINSSPTLRQRIGAAGTAAYIETVKVLLPPFGVAYEAYQAFKNPEN